MPVTDLFNLSLSCLSLIGVRLSKKYRMVLTIEETTDHLL
jgi:hypothetical protein